MPLIQPEKRTTNEQLNVTLSSEILQELRAYAQFLNKSSVSYVLTQLINTLGRDKEFQQWKAGQSGLAASRSSSAHKRSNRMASLLERIQNVFDNRQDLERERVRQEGYRAALHQTRDACSVRARSLKNEWRNELAGSRSETHASVHARYEAGIQGLNDAFTAFARAEPGITTQLNPDEFRESATRQAQPRSYEAPGLGRSSHHFAHAAGQQQDGREHVAEPTADFHRDEYQAGYDTERSLGPQARRVA